MIPTEHLQHKLNNEVTVIAEFKQKVDRSLLGNIKNVKAYEQMKDGKWSFVSSGQGDLREEIFYFAKNKDLTFARPAERRIFRWRIFLNK